MKRKRIKTLPIDDPVIAAAIDRALEPYKAIYPPAKIAQLREQMQILLTGHPYAIALANRVRPKPALAQSGTIPSGPTVSVTVEDEAVCSSGRGDGS